MQPVLDTAPFSEASRIGVAERIPTLSMATAS